MIGTIIGAVIAGLIIGALGRLLVPGKQNISILVTIVIGIVASLAANLILGAIFGYTGGGGHLVVVLDRRGDPGRRWDRDLRTHDDGTPKV